MKSNTILFVLIMGISTILTGCSDSVSPETPETQLASSSYWGNGRGNPQNTGRAPAVKATTLPQGARLLSRNPSWEPSWIYVGSASFNGSFAVIDSEGTVYYQGTNKYLYAVRKDGTLKWKLLNPHGNGFVAPVIGPDGRVYVGDYSGWFYCLDPTEGREIWSYDSKFTGQGFTTAPIITDDGRIYISSDAGYIFALDLDGNILWSYQNPYSFLGTPAVAKDGTVYAAIDKLYALDPSDGSLLWSFQPAEIADTWFFESTPVIAKNGTIYVIGYYEALNDEKGERQSHIFLFAVGADGFERWRYPLYEGARRFYGTRTMPTLQADETILVNVSPVNTIVALRPNGKLKTQLVLNQSLPPDAAPSIDGKGRIYLSLLNGFAVIDPDLSSIVQEKIITDGNDGRSIESSPSFGVDSVYFTCRREVFDPASQTYYDAGELYSFPLVQ